MTRSPKSVSFSRRSFPPSFQYRQERAVPDGTPAFSQERFKEWPVCRNAQIASCAWAFSALSQNLRLRFLANAPTAETAAQEATENQTTKHLVAQASTQGERELYR